VRFLNSSFLNGSISINVLIENPANPLLSSMISNLYTGSQLKNYRIQCFLVYAYEVLTITQLTYPRNLISYLLAGSLYSLLCCHPCSNINFLVQTLHYNHRYHLSSVRCSISDRKLAYFTNHSHYRLPKPLLTEWLHRLCDWFADILFPSTFNIFVSLFSGFDAAM